MSAPDMTPVSPETATLLRLAAAAQEGERYADAARLYAEALVQAPDHRAARFNHAVSCLRTVREGRNDAAGALASLEHLRALLDEERGAGDARGQWTPLRCSVIYNRALANWCLALRDDPFARRAEWMRALADARDVCAHTRGRRPAGRRRPVAQDPFWERLEAASSTLLAALVIAIREANVLPEGGRPNELDDAREALTRWGDTEEPRTAYNIALCYVGGVPGEPTADVDEALDRALAALDVALRDDTLVAWAYQDPLLAPLRAARTKRFERLIRRRLIQSGREFPPAPEQPAPVRRSPPKADDFDGAIPE